MLVLPNKKYLGKYLTMLYLLPLYLFISLNLVRDLLKECRCKFKIDKLTYLNCSAEQRIALTEMIRSVYPFCHNQALKG